MNFYRPTAILSILALLPFSCKDNSVDPEDQGKWLLLGLESESITAIAVDPVDESILYAGSGSSFSLGKAGGFFKSTDGGAVWDTLIRGVTVRDIDIHPYNSQTIYLTGGTNFLTLSGILKSSDGGMHWTRADSGIRIYFEEGPGVLAIDPMHPDTLYVGTGGEGGGHLYKSKDGGQTWEAIGTDVLYLIDGVTAIAIDPFNTDIIYVGTPGIGAIFKSTDGGSSWRRLNFPEVGIIYDLLIHTSLSGIVYAGTKRYGFYFSTNGGSSWQSVNAGLPDTTSVRKMVLPQGKKIYLAANDRQKGAAYETNQDNIEWKIIGDRTFDRINAIAVSKKSVIYAGAAGIYMFSD